MTNYNKQQAINSINLAMNVLKLALQETKTIMGVNKENGDLIFLSKEEYIKGNKVGFAIEIKEFEY